MGSPIKKIFAKLIKPITKSMKKMTNFFKLLFLYIKCSIKLIKNFYKCFIFYFLDCVKYTLLYLPILCLMGIVGLSKEWKPIQVTLDKLIGWPNSIQNDCYRCKNKKGEGMFDTLKKMVAEMLKGSEKESSFNFLSFLVVVGFGGMLIYMIWFTIRPKKLV